MIATLDLSNATTTPDTDRKTIKDYVIDDFRAAAVFEKYGLDFCCGAGKTLFEACQKHGIRYEDVKIELEDLSSFGRGDGTVSRFNDWSISFLADYIVQNHHLYVRRMIPVILMHADKVARVHAERWPYMTKVAELFAEIASELGSHMYKEEAILFPRLKQLEASLVAKSGADAVVWPLQLSSPITQMMTEDDRA
jgi:regulator of cell morphogenesis and NO signaling